MNESFNFNVFALDTPEQHIIFRKSGEDDLRVAIPGLTVPSDIQERFWFLHKKLVELNVIGNQETSFIL